MLHEFMCFAALPASDLDRARRWYSEKLGIEPAKDAGGGLQYEMGKGTGFLLYQSEFAGTNQATAMGWLVPDVDAELSDLRRRGVTFEDYDMPGLKTEDGVVTMPDGTKGAWFKDSEGNILSVGNMG